MDLKNIVLIVLDEAANFQSEITQLRIGARLFKTVIQVQDRAEFKVAYENLDDEQPFVLICHVFYGETSRLKGYIRLKTENIEEEYGIKAVLVSAGDSGEVMRDIYEKEQDRRVVYLYSAFRDQLKADNIKINKKSDMKQNLTNIGYSDENLGKQFIFDYGIITALYQDEFEEIEKLFTWVPEKYVDTKTKRYRVGHLVDHPEKTVVAAVPSASGMVDAAIVATQMLDFFRPRYLIMTGVCGGKKSLKFGSIIFASKIFTLQKGKLSDLKDEKGKPIKLFDVNNQPVDHQHLYDDQRNQVKVEVEKFEIEHDSIIEFDPFLKDIINPHLKKIESKINEPYAHTSPKKVAIHFEPMACSTMVINKEGYFEEKVQTVDRKTVAVEMESYGVARACQFANNGHTRFIICKSVMDNLTKKTDAKKRFAAYTSAQFLKYLLYDNILPLN